jgi:lipopolysaccharide transport system permease protein
MNSTKPSVQSPVWTSVLKPRTGWFDLDLNEIWQYWDLVKIFVYRDFVVYYKQTILGPLWFLIKPLFTTLVFTLVFNRIARIPTDHIPPILFYMSGTIIWNYFASCLNSTSNTFVANSGLFGKIYFPRLVIPLSSVISNMIQFSIQFLLFLGFFFFFLFKGTAIHPDLGILLTPLLIIHMAALGLGVGMIISSLTTKYRDLTFLFEFGVQLWMYATPVVYPLSKIPLAWQKWYVLNPMVSIVELFRLIFLGTSSIQPLHYVTSLLVTSVLLFSGIIIFNKAEKSFMDTV